MNWITSVFLSCCFAALTALDCGLHEHNLNDFRCCTKCGPGFGVVSECGQDNDTVCGPCQRGETYSLEYSHQAPCIPCTICPQYAQVKKTCSESQDTICECDVHYYWDSDGRSCQQCDLCPMGFGSKRRCGSQHNTVCVQCPQGTFSDVLSEENCRPCTPCKPNQIMLKYCDGYQDSLCVDIPDAPIESELELYTSTTIPTAITTSERNLIPIYCGALGLVIFVLIVCVVIRQIKTHRNAAPDTKNNVAYSAVSEQKSPVYNAPLNASQKGRHNALGSDSGICLEVDGMNSSCNIRELPVQKLKQMEALLHGTTEVYGGWTSLARELGYNNARIASIESRAIQTSALPAEILLSEWSNSKNATVNTLFRTLYKIGRADIVTAVCQPHPVLIQMNGGQSHHFTHPQTVLQNSSSEASSVICHRVPPQNSHNKLYNSRQTLSTQPVPYNSLCDIQHPQTNIGPPYLQNTVA